jgi:predicted RNase H-like HicB family nuclease
VPGCISEGETKEEALANIKEAIEGYLEAFLEKVKKQKEGAVEMFVRKAPLFSGVALN